MFKGLYTAIITPFNHDGTINKIDLFRLIDNQIINGVDGLVIMGTTGESPTISTEEHIKLIHESVHHVNGRCQVIAGTGSNATSEAIHQSIHAQKAGVDGLLLVNPYYNKPSQKGLYEHFMAIAEAVETPILLYNISGRTGVNLETETLVKLAKHPNIVGVKEASGDLQQIKEVINSVPEEFIVLAGDDGITMEVMKMGGHGVVSVLANLLPKEMNQLVLNCAEENWTKAQTIHDSLSRLFFTCFIETNPQPIKTMMAIEGMCNEVFRLPLTTMGSETKKTLLHEWENWKKQTKREVKPFYTI